MDLKCFKYTLYPIQVSVADIALSQPILALQNDRLFVNLHITIPLLIRECKCMAMMDIELPVVAATLLSRQARFDMMKDALNVYIWFLDL